MDGVVFVHSGIYKSAVMPFKIIATVDHTVKHQVYFPKQLFHPMTDSDGLLHASLPFPLKAKLETIKMVFQTAFIDRNLQQAPNLHAMSLFKNYRAKFVALASKSVAELSAGIFGINLDAALYKMYPDCGIPFHPMADDTFQSCQTVIQASARHPFEQ